MTLVDKDRRLVRLFAAIALGRWPEVEALRRAAPEGEPDREWREAVLQAHLFSGIPRLVEAYEVLDRAGGLGELGPDERRDGLDTLDDGARLFDRIYGANADDVRARLESFHPDYARWIAAHAYGEVLARPGLSAARRELLAVAALVATGQDRQLASHSRGAVHCGASRAEVFDVLEAIADLVRPERLARARIVLSRFARGAD